VLSTQLDVTLASSVSVCPSNSSNKTHLELPGVRSQDCWLALFAHCPTKDLDRKTNTSSLCASLSVRHLINMSSQPTNGVGSDAVLSEILSTLKRMQVDHASLAANVESLSSRVETQSTLSALRSQPRGSIRDSPSLDPMELGKAASSPPTDSPFSSAKPPPSPTARRSSVTSRIILTTYPGQSGIDPIPLEWGHPDPAKRGPVIVSRLQHTIRRRNAIGAHGGSYSIYNALAVASNNLDLEHKPDFTNTEPAANIGPFPAWGSKSKIVAMDPYGHLAPWLYKDLMLGQNIDIRPTIAVTKAHMKIPELEQSVQAGRLKPDGKICINAQGERAVTKFAVEPVWYLPGVADRFGIDEASLRRALFECKYEECAHS
jgi:hypothetical protein